MCSIVYNGNIHVTVDAPCRAVCFRKCNHIMHLGRVRSNIQRTAKIFASSALFGRGVGHSPGYADASKEKFTVQMLHK